MGRVAVWLLAAACGLSAAPPAPAQEAPADAEVPPLPAEGLTGGAAERFWLTGEYLLWQVQSTHLPALVGTIPASSADLIQQLPDWMITPLVGGPGARLDYPVQSGFRVGTGLWLDGERRFGLAGGYFQLGPGRQTFVAASAGGAALGPFFHDPAAGQDVVIMAAVPGLRAGSVNVSATNRLWGAEANALWRLPGAGWLDHLDLLAGFRHLQFSEGLLITGTSQAIPGGRLPCG